MTYFLFILLGFVLGSTLFAYWIPRLFFKTDITKVPPDHNPGVANAYMQAGFFAGTLSLLCELFKGAVPVFLADRILDRDSMLFALVMAAPVFGHAFPFFQKERGGKAIAVSFGVMIGLFPEIHPLFCLIFYYILFSLVLTLRPHSFRSVITYGPRSHNGRILPKGMPASQLERILPVRLIYPSPHAGSARFCM